MGIGVSSGLNSSSLNFKAREIYIETRTAKSVGKSCIQVGIRVKALLRLRFRIGVYAASRNSNPRSCMVLQHNLTSNGTSKANPNEPHTPHSGPSNASAGQQSTSLVRKRVGEWIPLMPRCIHAYMYIYIYIYIYP